MGTFDVKARGDAQEHEAERVAERIAPEPRAAAPVGTSVQPGGGALDPSLRAELEPSLGPLGAVRLHADDAAAGAARGLRAKAFTVGSDVFFGAGQYAPGTARGRKLLAHELTHVAQQRGKPPVIQRAPEDNDPLHKHDPKVVAAFDHDRKGSKQKMGVDKLIKLLAPYLTGDPRARVAILARVDKADDDPRQTAIDRAELWKKALMAMVDVKRWPESYWRTGLIETLSGPDDAGAPQLEVSVEYAPEVVSKGPGGPGASAAKPQGPPAKPPAKTDPAAPPSSGVEYKPPLTIIIKAGGGEVLKIAVPKEVKLSTPPLGTNQIVISVSGSLNDLLKLLKPEEAPVPPGGVAPVKPGPPVSAGMSLSVQTGPNVTVRLAGTYDFEARNVTTGLTFVVTTPYGECALPSGSTQKIIDALKKLAKFGLATSIDASKTPMATPPPVTGTAPPAKPNPSGLTITADQVPEAAVTIGEAVAALVEQMDALESAKQQCMKGKDKKMKVEVGPTVTVPTGPPPTPTSTTTPAAPAGVTAGIGLKLYFD